MKLENNWIFNKIIEEFLKEISKVIPVIRVNYSEFKTAEEMAQIIKREYDSMLNIKNVDYK